MTNYDDLGQPALALINCEASGRLPCRWNNWEPDFYTVVVLMLFNSCP